MRDWVCIFASEIFGVPFRRHNRCTQKSAIYCVHWKRRGYKFQYWLQLCSLRHQSWFWWTSPAENTTQTCYYSINVDHSHCLLCIHSLRSLLLTWVFVFWTSLGKMSILGKGRLTGQKESQACLWFPGAPCVYEYVCVHQRAPRCCLASETAPDSWRRSYQTPLLVILAATKMCKHKAIISLQPVTYRYTVTNQTANENSNSHYINIRRNLFRWKCSGRPQTVYSWWRSMEHEEFEIPQTVSPHFTW